MCFSFFLFVFRAKSATAKNHRTVPYQSPFNHKALSNEINKFLKSFHKVELNQFEFFKIFRQISSELASLNLLIYAYLKPRKFVYAQMKLAFGVVSFILGTKLFKN